MAITNGNLAASAVTSGGRYDSGKGVRNRVAAGLAATAALGLSLLAGIVFGEGYRATVPMNGNPAGARPAIWAGTCRAGSSECVPDEDYLTPTPPHAMPHGWAGLCRAGGSECLPDEDYLTPTPSGRVAPVVGPAGTLPGGSTAAPGQGTACLLDDPVLCGMAPRPAPPVHDRTGPADEHTQADSGTVIVVAK